MLSGVLFDFSGTLVHTESLYHAVARTVFAQAHNEEIDIDELRAHSGLPFNDRFEYMLANRGMDDDELLARLTKEAEEQFRKEYSTHGALVAGAKELILALHERSIPTAVVSSAGSTHILSELKKVDLHNHFATVIGADSVRATKPHPEPYIKALEELQVEPQHVVAFEDSPAGIESASLAGIKTIGLLTTFDAHDLSKTEKTIHDYTNFTIEDIENVLQ